MRLPKNHIRVSLLIFGIVIVALIFASIMKFTTNDTFADDDGEHKLVEPHFVTFYDQGKKLTVKTDAVTVGEALSRAGYELSDTDIVEPDRNSLINLDNFHINIYRSRPVIIMDGKIKKYVMTASYDPRTIAEDAGFTIYDGDDIEMVENSNFLEAGSSTTYKITRSGGETVTVEATIPFSEETKEDSSLSSGETKVTQEGETGRKVTKYAVQFVDGVEVSRELISEEVVKEPVNKITTVGSKKAASNIPPEWETCAGWARQAGVSEADLSDALTLIYHESGCRTGATNSYSGAYGIPQALPGSKMASQGSDWETNPVTQIRWMAEYVTKRYGGWSQALTFWWCTGSCNGVSKSGHWY
ncbi:G5 domain-containing protein [Candidatus Saccharibacteria bacterium]|nr:G5 domain-containing protein [Candidatus Saccharibacteria bacterium]MBR3233920.1 G5 domain-containing protein [Candidatus Saccharibacteria bacterium]